MHKKILPCIPAVHRYDRRNRRRNRNAMPSEYICRCHILIAQGYRPCDCKSTDPRRCRRRNLYPHRIGISLANICWYHCIGIAKIRRLGRKIVHHYCRRNRLFYRKR